MFASQRMRVGLFDDYLQGMNKIWGNVGWWIGSQGDSLSNYLKEHCRLAALLSGVAIAAYGFELFNLNLTIDEEIHAFASQDTMWIAQGRWGMFVLNRLLIPSLSHNRLCATFCGACVSRHRCLDSAIA